MSAILSREQLRMPGSCPTIETRRLVLRQHRRTDADAIMETLGDFQIARMLSRVPLPYDRQDALDWLSAAIGSSAPDWYLAITTGDDVHIGVVSIELRHGLWHLGYWLNRYYWGRGFMSEAASAVTERFFRRMPGETLHSGAFADNGASLRVQAKIGFIVMGGNDLYCRPRNAMAPHILTRLSEADFRPVRP